MQIINYTNNKLNYIIKSIENILELIKEQNKYSFNAKNKFNYIKHNLKKKRE